jgi:hypothetical protein
LNDSASSNAEASLLLWFLAAGVATLAVHVCLGWVRQAQRAQTWRPRAAAALVAAATMATGLCSAVVLCLGAEALSFPLGYRWPALPVLWLASLVGALPLMAWLARTPPAWALVGCGLWLAALAAAVQFGWVWAAGFRPGIHWRPELLAATAIVLSVGCAVALWMAFGVALQQLRRRSLWRLGAAALASLALLAGQEILMVAAGLSSQIGSVYVHEVPGSLLSLLCGVLVPLLLSAMAVDLMLRRPRPRRTGPVFPLRDGGPGPRRRQRVRRL